ncbi:hypothetical protein L2E82_10875 [Cichorium intybus]|uniref:Uncharacterized protein n=1 Tax=Cichorium intybus TaxID=13427 RepID=A0ACB9GDS2_CICIN|nr:hypothetical protein L2E82_10875 [Cichorium intybus]
MSKNGVSKISVPDQLNQNQNFVVRDFSSSGISNPIEAENQINSEIVVPVVVSAKDVHDLAKISVDNHIDMVSDSKNVGLDVSDSIVANRSYDYSNSLVDNVNSDGNLELEMVITNRYQEEAEIVSDEGSAELKLNLGDDLMDSDGSRASQEAIAASVSAIQADFSEIKNCKVQGSIIY